MKSDHFKSIDFSGFRGGLFCLGWYCKTPILTKDWCKKMWSVALLAKLTYDEREADEPLSNTFVEI